MAALSVILAFILIIACGYFATGGGTQRKYVREKLRLFLGPYMSGPGGQDDWICICGRLNRGHTEFCGECNFERKNVEYSFPQPATGMPRRRKILLGSAAAAAAVLIAAGIFFRLLTLPFDFALVPEETVWRAETVFVTGMYGLKINMENVTGMSLERPFPVVVSKVRGFRMKNLYRGDFELEGLGEARLIVADSQKPPFIHIHTDDGLVILNHPDPGVTTLRYSRLLWCWRHRQADPDLNGI